MSARSRGIVVAIVLLAIVSFLWWLHPPAIASFAGGTMGHSSGSGPDLARGTRAGESPSARPRGATDDDGAAIEGTVVDAKHSPVDGARVAAVIADRISAIPTSQRIAHEAMSASGGRFRLDHLSAGPFGITATFPGRAAAYRGGIVLGRGQTLAGIEIVLADGGTTIHGTISDAGGGAVPAAHLRAIRYSTDDGDIFATLGDDAGHFSITLGVGSYTFVASAPGYAPREIALLVRRDETLDFKLDPSSGVHGIVVTKADGAPAAGAQVSLDQRSGRRWLGTKEATADGAGHFVFEDLSAGEFQLSARSGAMAAHLSRTITVGLAQRADDVRLELVPAHSVAGRVKDSHGKAVAGAEVLLGDADRGWGKSLSAKTDGDGRFRIEGVFSGHYQPLARAPGFSNSTADDFELRADDKTGIEIVLLDGASVSGTAVGADGAPIEGALVRVVVRRSAHGAVIGTGVDRTRADGGFHVEDLPAGVCSVDAAHPAHGRAIPPAFDLAAGDAVKVDLHLREIASISGRVSWDDGTPAAGVEVVALAKFGTASDVTGPDGRYELRTLDAGHWTLEATRTAEAPLDEAHPGVRTIELVVGQHVTGFDLTLAREGAEISGKVVTPDGVPIADVDVEATPAASWGGGTGTATAADGTFRFADLDPGEFRLRATRPGFAPALVEAEAGDSEIRIVLKSESILAGTAIGADGKPVTDYQIAAFAPNASNLSGRAPQKTQEEHDPAGAFEIGGLEPGSYDLVVTAADGRTGTLPAITVAEGKRKDGLVVRVAAGATVKGRLVELGTNQPIAGAKLYVYGNGAAQTRTVASDGSFLLDGIPPGWSLYVNAGSDPSRYVIDHYTIPISAGGGSLDVGTLKLIAEPLSVPRGPGLGIVGDWRPSGATVLFSEGGSPAEQAGIGSDDVLISVGGLDVTGLGAAGIARVQQGPPGSTVEVSWRPASGGATRTATIARP